MLQIKQLQSSPRLPLADMPWTPAQHRLFEWVKQNPQAARRAGYKIPQADAARMAHEGIGTPRNRIAEALLHRRQK